MIQMENLRIGTSSFSEEDWVGPFYPKGTKPREFLREYAKRYDTVEIDATYYAVPSAQTVHGWRDKTPENFQFSAKFPRSIVHCGNGPRPNGANVLTPAVTYDERDRFLDVMSLLGRKLGPLLIQFPYFNKEAFGSRSKFFERLTKFLGDLPKEFRYAVEIRNKAWLKPEFVEIIKEHNCALTLVDQAWMPHADELPEDIPLTTTDFCYIRLIGDRKEIEAITESWGKEVIDRSEKLERWVEIIRKITVRNINTLLYVNNHFAGHAPTIITRLQESLDRLSGERSR